MYRMRLSDRTRGARRQWPGTLVRTALQVASARSRRDGRAVRRAGRAMVRLNACHVSPSGPTHCLGSACAAAVRICRGQRPPPGARFDPFGPQGFGGEPDRAHARSLGLPLTFCSRGLSYACVQCGASLGQPRAATSRVDPPHGCGHLESALDFACYSLVHSILT